MRITRIVETSVPLRGEIANALVDFSRHTVSMVAVVSDGFDRRHAFPSPGMLVKSVERQWIT
ncbi:hypothetical protein KV112_04555 [Mycolicibacter sp. MYC123]|uniref:Uncharacterized protein n=1 Tax=[Mycobacterium] zoologicum TaxID=2872311 RepID=A0ABU5YJ37_9MYCO|nr:hypothetical protein [Mycolicibacter sp. MYC123]MEB3049019.1 hypothetical protein [Mycolicibacter sp. MYC123]